MFNMEHNKYLREEFHRKCCLLSLRLSTHQRKWKFKCLAVQLTLFYITQTGIVKSHRNLMQFQETTRGISHLSPFAEICIDHWRVIQQSGYESFLGSSQIRLQVFQNQGTLYFERCWVFSANYFIHYPSTPEYSIKSKTLIITGFLEATCLSPLRSSRWLMNIGNLLSWLLIIKRTFIVFYFPFGAGMDTNCEIDKNSVDRWMNDWLSGSTNSNVWSEAARNVDLLYCSNIRSCFMWKCAV